MIRRLLPLLVLLCAACQQTPTSDAAFVNQARQLHQQLFASAAAGDAEVQEYLGKIVQRLHAAAREVEKKRAADPMLSRLAVYVIDCDTANALSTGGEQIYLYHSLVEQAQSEEELAALLAHEFAHVLHLDLQQTKIKPVPNQPPERIVWQFVNNRLTPAQEASADELAMRLYARGGWDVSKYAGLYQRLNARGLNLSDKVQRAQVAAAGVSPEQRIWWRQENVADEETFRLRRDQAKSLAARRQVPPNMLMLLRAFPNCILPADQGEQVEAQRQLQRLLAPPPPRVEPS